MTYAQQEPTVGVDGLKLGMSVSDALYEIGKMGDYKLDNRNDSEKWLRYKDGSNSYTIYYNSQNKICCIYKYNERFYPYMIEEIYNSAYVDILYECGEPIIQGNTSTIWRGNNYKITLSIGSHMHPYVDRVVYSISQNYEIVE